MATADLNPAGADSAVELDNLKPADPTATADTSAAPEPTPAERLGAVEMAQSGNIAALAQLIDDGEIEATAEDRFGASLLHWAAANNRREMCRFLVDRGADVDHHGGEVNGTPALWAVAHNCIFVVDQLLGDGASQTATDCRGSTLLHAAATRGFDHLVLYLLTRGLDPEVADNCGQTALMWAAYQGKPGTADVLLQWGVQTNTQDDRGCSALHWAVTSGNLAIGLKLVEYGASCQLQTSQGETVADTANDIGRLAHWNDILDRAGFLPSGAHKRQAIPFVHNNRLFFRRLLATIPAVLMLPMFLIVAWLPLVAAIPAVLAGLFGFQHALRRLLRLAPRSLQKIEQSPMLAGVFMGATFWEISVFLTRIAPTIVRLNPVTTVATGLLFGSTCYYYGRAMTTDPGFVKAESGREDQARVVKQLVADKKYDHARFCIRCMARRPLRSRHCRICQRCVGRHDHHCPWIDSCVGAGNHRPFLLFVASLWAALIAAGWTGLLYLSALPDRPAGSGPECVLLQDDYCAAWARDSFGATVVTTACFQLTWVSMLLLVQLIQVGRGMTTWESMRGFYHETSAGALEDVFGPLPQTDQMAGQPVSTSSGIAAAPPQQRSQARQKSLWTKCASLFGVDVFMMTATRTADAEYRARQRSNPYGHGLITNCADFWLEPDSVFGADGRSGKPSLSLLAGKPVDYTVFYRAPAKPLFQSRTGMNGAVYQAVGDDDLV